MVEFRLDQIAQKIRGEIQQGHPALIFSRFNIDSRLTRPGELFFAIKARRNGHSFIPEAAEKGAAGAVISEDVPAPNDSFALIRVADTVAALQELARAALAACPVKIVGITGSVGKTTTKEFAAALIEGSFRVLKSEGNMNNHLGLALSLLRLRPSDEVAVLEMAMSAPGEIRALTRMAPPDIAVITNISPVHLEFFPDLEAIARAKKEILEGAKIDATAVLNGDDPLIRKISRDWTGRRILFGFSPRCDIRASQVRSLEPEGLIFDLHLGAETREVRLPVIYEDYVMNVLAALGAAYALGVPFSRLAERIPHLRPFAGRGILLRLSRGIRLVDDSYNSNPRALESALRSLARFPGRKVAVLGEMLELGPEEKEFHLQAGKQAVEYGWEVLITIGRLGDVLAEGAHRAGMPEDRIFSFADSAQAADKISALILDGDLILVKGSHSVKTEVIVEKLKELFKER